MPRLEGKLEGRGVEAVRLLVSYFPPLLAYLSTCLWLQSVLNIAARGILLNRNQLCGAPLLKGL